MKSESAIKAGAGDVNYEIGALAQAARNFIVTRNPADLATLDRLAATALVRDPLLVSWLPFPSAPERDWMAEWKALPVEDRNWTVNMLHGLRFGDLPPSQRNLRLEERGEAVRLAINVLAGWDGYSLALEDDRIGPSGEDLGPSAPEEGEPVCGSKAPLGLETCARPKGHAEEDCRSLDGLSGWVRAGMCADCEAEGRTGTGVHGENEDCWCPCHKRGDGVAVPMPGYFTAGLAAPEPEPEKDCAVMVAPTGVRCSRKAGHEGWHYSRDTGRMYHDCAPAAPVPEPPKEEGELGLPRLASWKPGDKWCRLGMCFHPIADAHAGCVCECHAPILKDPHKRKRVRIEGGWIIGDSMDVEDDTEKQWCCGYHEEHTGSCKTPEPVPADPPPPDCPEPWHWPAAKRETVICAGAVYPAPLPESGQVKGQAEPSGGAAKPICLYQPVAAADGAVYPAPAEPQPPQEEPNAPRFPNPPGRRFRKRPIVIEAVQFRRDGVGYVDVCRFLGIQPETALPPMIQIFTLEGPMRADYGDWIIKGVKGEFYPCKPDIFEATYEPE